MKLPEEDVELRPEDSSPLGRVSFLMGLQYLVLGSAVLYFGRDLFIPLAIAVLISFVLYPICSAMERKGVRRMPAIVISVTVLMIVFLFLLALLAKQFVDFAKEWPVLQERVAASLRELSMFLASSLDISKEQQLQWISQITDQAAGGLITFIKGAISFSSITLVMLLLVPVYVVLILYYRNLWVGVLNLILPGKKESVREILLLSVHTYYNFIKGMGIVYLAVGILNSAGLLILGVPHAILFGFVASVLTFVPYIGIIVGSLLPITMAWLTYDSVWYPVGIVGIFTFVQYLEANVIFPFAVSSRLNVNTLVMLLSIFAGGLLWGVAGMVLFVPFVGILKLIADHNPAWAALSKALGTDTH